MGGWIRKNIMTGVLVSAPVFLTFYTLYLVVGWLDSWLIRLLPPAYRIELVPGTTVPGLGIVAGLVLLFLIGLVARNFLGKHIVLWFELLMARLPIARGIYGAVKQVMEAFGGGSSSFREVVMVPFPYKGSYSLGFITGVCQQDELRKASKEVVYNVFIPTTPNPTNGFLMFVPERDIIRCDMSVDDGLKLIVSGGIVNPKPRAKAAVKSVGKKAAKR